MAAVPLSKSELDFTVQALRRESVRVDGRALAAYRRLGIRFGPAHGEVEVNFGPSRAMAVCSGEIITPPANRPNEGRIQFHVEFGPLASPSFEVGRPSPQAVSVSNFVERLLKGSRAIDAEALCIVGGQKVWSIRVDVRALDDDGNLGDVCAIAALCSLLHFRKADVEVVGETAKTFAAEERVPVPLSIHHLPVPVTFALFPAAGSGASGKEGEPAWILDPNRLEEAAAAGSLCIAVNQHGELCGVHKPGGMPVDFAMVEHCIELAISRAKEITSRIQSEIDADLAKRKEAKKNVHQAFAKGSLLTVDWSASDSKEAAEPSAPAAPPVLRVLPEVTPALIRPDPSANAPLGIPGSAPAVGSGAGRWRQRAEDRQAVEDTAMVDVPANMQDDIDIAAELEAVAAEAAELEAQLAEAADADLEAASEAGQAGSSTWRGGVSWETLGGAASASAPASVPDSSAEAAGAASGASGAEDDLGAAVVKRKKKKIRR
eukprot:TRINITY_DN63973_c0_g1_i1.p1 TRINITY_DN63973_c0_g1~~TRINITY_DN63973_c0_g1_i1.p1  ORF type:complete len:500 (+),score=152.61 TRINITY_DN63973_c0_g1_i1:33-1502(+)